MQFNITVLAKSDKHNGYCVAALTQTGKLIRLVRDAEGHALTKEQCQFQKGDMITVNVEPAPLKWQKENYILTEVLSSKKSLTSLNYLSKYTQNTKSIFSNTNPWLSSDEMAKNAGSLLLVAVDDLTIYKNDEDKYKANFTYNGQSYEGFSVTDPDFKKRKRKMAKAFILVSLPNSPYGKYGQDLFYKYICAVYPIDNLIKTRNIDAVGF
ncbi:MAG: hypothetical protein FWE06_06885 [Oscillospiraceae bacterium]|nr:hypothetical protein [Oscillospiraceae bacterium]